MSRAGLGKLWNFIAFQIAWFACVLGAGHGDAWLGAIVTAPLLVLHFAFADQRARHAVLMLVTLVCGTLLDALMHALSVYDFAKIPVLGLSPLWMQVLWLAFASTFAVSMRWLMYRPKLAIVIGALVGPPTYVAGVQLGALEFPGSRWVSLGAIAAMWMFVMGGASWLTRRIIGIRSQEVHRS